ncbi:hypothetical protein [Longimicrobium sp.]|uniref:hypothetical protein n=1 Tax=Longimicrobium sp. TaxID=2029185 RepID=UPI002E345FDD|nr:hypothetical protein [Longimicrobium sp.]HEX6038216.1 hypothetical protein [Longimicrobium sp.]
MTHPAEGRIAEIVGAVARQALADRGAARIALLDDGGPEAALAARLLERALDDGAVVRVTADGAGVEPFLPHPGAVPRWRVEDEARRLRARLMDGVVAAHPANKTALLLGGELPPEPLLPLGDLWATDVAAMAGGWSAPPEVGALADAAGGIEALDDALRRRIDGRDPRGLDRLPRDVAERIRILLAAGSAARRVPRIVPKLAGRTIGIDLME